MFAGGYAKASPDFGCGKVSAPGTSDAALVVKYGPTGTCAWSKLFGDAGAAASHVTGLASDLAGDVYVAGDIAGSIDFGGGKLTSGGGTDGYLAKLDANGGYLWAQRFGDAAEQLATRVTVDQGGNAVVIGTYQGTLDLGGGKSVTSAGAEDVFVAKWSPQGTVLWVKTFGGAGNQLGRDVVVDGSNAIFITGVNNGTIDLGAGPLVSAGMGDAFIAKLDANGVPQWSKEFGDGGDQTGTGVAVDAAGNLIVTGSFETKLDLGGGYVFTSLALHDVWLAKFDTGGKLLWGAAGQGADNQLSDDVGVDLSGNITIFGGFFGDINFGAPTTKMTTAGLADIFIARFSSAGTPLWASRFGDASSQVMKAGAVDLAGHSVGVGVCFGTVNFGAGPIVGHGGEDFCVAKFGP